MSVLDSILDSITNGTIPSIDQLGGIGAIKEESDSLSKAPILDILVELSASANDQFAIVLDALLIKGFQVNTHAIPFRNAVEGIVKDLKLFIRIKPQLIGVLEHRAQQRSCGQQALIASYALEALFRLSLAGEITKYRPLAIMAEISSDECGIFAAHAAKLVGAAYHIWRDDSLLSVLHQLNMIPDAEDEASFELGIAHLSMAIETHDLGAALDRLDSARVYFDRSCGMGEDRDDAVAYRATIDIIKGFACNWDVQELSKPLELLEHAVQRWATWLDVAEMPDWLRPRKDREINWVKLLRQAKSVAKDLTRCSWLNARQIMENVFNIYDADRTIGCSPELNVFFRPRIEAAFVKEGGLLAHLSDLIELHDWPEADHDTATRLQKRIEQLSREAPSPGKRFGDADFPLLNSILENEQLTGEIPEKTRMLLENGLQDHQTTQSYDGNIILNQIANNIQDNLRQSNHYRGATRYRFDEILFHILTFVSSRLDSNRTMMGRRGEYLFSADATEWDLQADLYEYIRGNLIRADVNFELTNVASGRADIVVSFGEFRFVIELKREKLNNSRDKLRRYLSQTGAYQVTDVRLGFLGVLDLSDRTGPPPHIEESIWTEDYVPDGAYLVRNIVVFRVSGRLKIPSSFK